MLLLLLFIFIILIIGIFCCAFFLPFYLEINTVENLYRIRLYRFGSANLLMRDDTLMLEIKIFNWKKQIDLLAIKQHSEKIKIKKEELVTHKKSKRNEVSFRKMMRVLGSFKINRCEILIDTGNIQLNAFLFPIFYLLQMKTSKNIQINFIGNNKLIIEIENNLARMSWAYLSS